MKTKSNVVIKRILGITLLILFILLSRELISRNISLGLFLLIGLGLGYIESRSEIGIASGYMDFFITGSRTRLYGLLLLFGVGTLAAIGIHFQAAMNGAVPDFRASNLQSVIPGTSAVTPINFGLILGSFLFGVGMTINEGCGLGTLRNTGQGKIRYVWTLLFILIGTIPGQLFKYSLDQSIFHDISIQVYLPDFLGYTGTAIFIIAILFILALIARKYEQERRKEDTYQPTESHNLPQSDREVDAPIPVFSKKFFTHLFKTEWARLISVGLITLLLILALVVTGEKLAVTQPFVYPATALFQKLGVPLEHAAFEEPMSIVQNGLVNDTNSLQNFGIIIGALIFSLTSGRFSISWTMKLKDSLQYMVGGLLMGLGAVLASGCIVGALYSGIVNFSLSGWVVFASMSLGIYITVKMLNGKIPTIPKVD